MRRRSERRKILRIAKRYYVSSAAEREDKYEGGRGRTSSGSQSQKQEGYTYTGKSAYKRQNYRYNNTTRVGARQNFFEAFIVLLLARPFRTGGARGGGRVVKFE
ncbi:hypothetical protein [Candidatus Alkanophaga liquidiphilum]